MQFSTGNEGFGEAKSIRAEERAFVSRYRSPLHWTEVFRTYYGPLNKAYGALSGRCIVVWAATAPSAAVGDRSANTSRFRSGANWGDRGGMNGG